MPTLEQKIRKHNPELQELTFGCEFIWKSDSDELCAVFENWVTKNESIRCMTRPFFTQTIVTRDRIVEIIGRPISLANVLIAIEKSGKANGTAMWSDGELEYADDGETYCIKIDLSLPFSQWSPEVHEFINKLID